MRFLGWIWCCLIWQRHSWVTEHYNRGPYLERVYRRCRYCQAHGGSIVRPIRGDTCD